MGVVLSDRTETPRKQSRRVRAAGFSLLEVLMATVLLAMVLLGVMPLFARSSLSNREGWQLTQVTNRARLHMETLSSLPFDSPDLTIPAGETELETTDLWSVVQEAWIPEAGFPGDEQPAYSRTTRVRQFSSTAVSRTDIEFADAEALVGGTNPSRVHLKEIEIRVNSGQPSNLIILGRRKAVSLKLLKSV